MKLPGVRSLLLLGCMAILVLAAGALARNAQTPGASGGGKPAESEWLVESPHTPAQMAQAADRIKDIALWHWGCESGDHRGWIIVRAADEQAALGIVPEALRGRARAHKLNRFTIAQLKAFHEHGQ
ncbi:MAG TPA: hypothetical protein VMS88_00630 [Terriglobales bacterium]|nr:hypothetical protein [Terriglobales bacterium]